jgi:hypothetical protein
VVQGSPFRVLPSSRNSALTSGCRLKLDKPPHSETPAMRNESCTINPKSRPKVSRSKTLRTSTGEGGYPSQVRSHYLIKLKRSEPPKALITLSSAWCWVSA